MNQDPVKVKQIEWTSVLPSLHLVQALRYGYRVRTLVPGLCAVGLVQLVLWPLDFSLKRDLLNGDFGLIDSLQRVGNPVQVLMTTSWWMLVPSQVSIIKLMTVCLLVQLIALAFGIGISRAVASEFCAQERSGASRNLKLIARRTLAALKISIAFLAFGFIAFIPVLLVRAFAWLVGPCSFLTTVLPLLSLVAIPVILVWILLLVTGPLAAAAIATDDCGPADAVSRSINYVLSHKLQVVLMVASCLTLARISGSLAELLISISSGIAAFGLPESVTEIKRTLLFGDRSEAATTLSMVRLIATAVEFAVLQSALTIGYVLLRKTEDSIPYREFSREI